jgi:transcriptional regulator with XRE-family HTH domain
MQNERMHSSHAVALRQCDPLELGGRVRGVRISKGLTQSDLADQDVSVAYLSRIESGQRRPSAKVLAALADRLEVSIEELLGQLSPREADEVRVTLDFAELSLESGEPQEAANRAREALRRLESSSGDAMRERARFLHARALEALGRSDDAIVELEGLIGGGVSGLTRIRAGIALSRVYRESGDLGRAIDVGERLLPELEETGLGSCAEAVQLTVTVAAAYVERGDSGHALRMCRQAMASAEALDSPTARAAAYWNASAIQAQRGEFGDAVPLAERALALLSEGKDARNFARLRAELGRLQLALDPPAVEEAERNLQRAAEGLAWSSAAPVDRAWAHLGLARARFLSGDLMGSREMIMTVLFASEGGAPLVEAEAKALEGQTYAAEGDMPRAARSYQQAVHLLSGIGADKGAGQLWFDLAGLLEQVGLADAARDAYRRAAASAGLRARSTTPSRTFATR